MMNYSDEFKAIVLGALLHDIGKFWQRADPEISYLKSNIISSETRNNISSVCPKYKNEYSHKHALWTNEFFVQNHDLIKKQAGLTENLGYDNTANLASYHHNPSTELQHLIQIADWYSSGMDRINDPDLEDEEKGYKFRKTRLKPVFESVKLGDQLLKQEYRYNLLPLEYSDNIFPIKKDEHTRTQGDLFKDYNKLWENFINDLNRIRLFNFYQYSGALLSLLERYTWCIPSSTNDLPDISLFDHLKTTAAIASCLYVYHLNKNNFNKTAIRDREISKFILFSADLSGIQNYIFDLQHSGIKKLSKILRARSFYLSYLPKLLITKILTDLNLTQTNNIMESGGRVILLLPNTESVQEYLNKTEVMIKKWCIDEFYGELTINFSTSIKLCGNDFTSNGFRERLKEINNELELKKLKKMDFLTDDDFNGQPFVITEDYNLIVENNGRVCSVTGKKPAKPGIDPKNPDNEISVEAYMQGEIGKFLTRSSVTVFSRIPPKENGKPHLKFLEGDQAIYIYLFKNQAEALTFSHILDIEQIGEVKDKSWIKQIHFANHVPVFKPGELDNYKRYVEENFNNEEKDDLEIFSDGIKTFNLIAVPQNKIDAHDEKEAKRGTHMLGILKADVDNLGQLFSRGLGDRLAISRYSTLSRSINLFFSGYLDQLLEDKYPNIYTVYAGGDDLFMIGRWDDIFNFSRDMNQKFRSFTCHNPDIHLSAGITLMKPHQPVKKAAEFAEEQLRLAKQNGKARLNMFSTSILWDKMREVLQWFNFFNEKYIDDESKINSGFLYRLLQYKRLYNLYDKEQKADGLIFLSQLSYDLKRNIERKDNKNNIVNTEEIEQIKKLQELNGEVPMEFIHIPIILTLYKNRGGN